MVSMWTFSPSVKETGIAFFPAETEQRVPGWLQHSLVKVHLLERLNEENVRKAPIVYEDVMYSEASYVCCCYESVCVRKISNMEVIFVEGNWYHGPSWPVKRQPWQYGVHPSF